MTALACTLIVIAGVTALRLAFSVLIQLLDHLAAWLYRRRVARDTEAPTWR